MPRLRSIALTLFLTLTLTSLGIIALLVLLFRLSLDEGFSDYVSRLELARLDTAERNLLARYQSQGSWNFARSPHDLLTPDHVQQPPPQGGPRDERLALTMGPPPPSDILQLGPRMALFDAQQRLVVGPSSSIPRPKRPLRLGDGRLVGYLGLAPVVDAGEEPLTRQFMQSQTRNLVLGGGLAVLLSALAAAWLAHHFRRPITDLARTVGRMARGQLDARAAVVDRRDELGELARDFNRMAQMLEQFEQSRRQFVADTSHELRTPLTILRVHIEAMRDGIMPLDQRGVARLSGAIGELEHLVDDLYLLARADIGVCDYQIEPVPLADLFDDLAERFDKPMRQAGLHLRIDTPPPLMLRGDPSRLRQLFGNLLGNALRYTDAGGEVSLTASANGQMVEILLDDSAPGVPDAALPHLFRRFYRVDASRSRAKGGAGLGLAICQTIVTGHAGDISATHSPLGGLRVTVRLPQETGTPQ